MNFLTLINPFSSKTNEDEQEDPTPYLKNCIYTNDYVKFYQTDARDFVNYIDNACFQRNVNEEHCVGTFKVVMRIDTENIKLIDGQHRVLALYKLMQEDAKFNMELFLEIYEVKTLDEEKEWFRRANNVKNFDEQDLPNVSAEEIVERLKNEFKEVIVTTKLTQRVYRPKVSEQLLTVELKKIHRQTCY